MKPKYATLAIASLVLSATPAIAAHLKSKLTASRRRNRRGQL